MQTVGRYQILDKLGQGGMGTVYKAYDPLIARVVAVKVISAQLDVHPEWRDRFFREARAAGQLSHPNIITIYDLGEQDDQPYLAMEYLEGRDLDRRMRGSDNMTLARKLEIAMAVCEGLAHAHEMGIVHRDVKPANVFITDAGHVKILDFGLARVLSSDLTHSRVMLGTMNYMAPEQIRGEKIDHRADIFALGVLCYELLCGRKAFQSDSFAATMYQILQHEPEPVERLNPNLPPQLSPIVARAMEKSREDRYQHMTDVLHDLDLVYEQLRGGITRSVGRIEAGPYPAAPSSDASRHLDVDLSNAPTMAGVLTPSLDAPTHIEPRPGSGSGPRSDRGSAPPLGAPEPEPLPAPPAPSRTRAAWVAATAVLVAVAVIWMVGRVRQEAPESSGPAEAPRAASGNAAQPQPTPREPEGGAQPATPPEPSAAPPTPPPEASAPRTEPERQERATEPPPAAKARPSRPAERPGRRETASPDEPREAIRAATQAFAAVAAARSSAASQRAADLAPDAWAAASREEAEARALYGRHEYAPATARLYSAAGLFKTAEGLARDAAEAAAEAREQAAAEAREKAAQSQSRVSPTLPAPPEPVPAPPPRAEAPPSRSPAPAPPQPAGPPPEQAILAGVRRYVAALEQRDMPALKALWPSLSGREQAAIQSDFSIARSIDAEISNPKVQVDGAVATVVGRRRYAVQTRDGHHLETVTITTIRFRNVDGVWQIDSVHHQPVQ